MAVASSIVLFSGLSVCVVSGGIVGSIVVENSEKLTSMAADASTVDCVNWCDLRRVKGLSIIVLLVLWVFAVVCFVVIIIHVVVGIIIGTSSSVASSASAMDCIGSCGVGEVGALAVMVTLFVCSTVALLSVVFIVVGSVIVVCIAGNSSAASSTTTIAGGVGC